MATATESWSLRTYTRAPDRWTAQRGWTVIDATDQEDAIDATGVSTNEGHPENAVMLTAKSPTVRSRGPNCYQVIWTYETAPSGSHSTTENPLLEPISILWTFQEISEAIDRDIHGNPITNSAGELYDPPIQVPMTDRYLHIYRNEPIFNATQAIAFHNKVNEDVFRVMGAQVCDVGQAICKSIHPTAKYQIGVSQFVPVEYVFCIRDDGWRKRIKDEGFQGLAQIQGIDDPALVEFVDPMNERPTRPVALDGYGHAQNEGWKLGVADATRADGDLPDTVEKEFAGPGNDVVWLLYTVHDTKRYADLGFDN